MDLHNDWPLKSLIGRLHRPSRLAALPLRDIVISASCAGMLHIADDSYHSHDVSPLAETNIMQPITDLRSCPSMHLLNIAPSHDQLTVVDLVLLDLGGALGSSGEASGRRYLMKMAVAEPRIACGVQMYGA